MTGRSVRDLAAEVADDGADVDDLLGAITRVHGRHGAPSLLETRGVDPRHDLEAWCRRDVRVALPGSASWPSRLDPLPDPPVLLAIRGSLPAPDVPTVAVVGQRRATSHGREVAAWLADAVARLGVAVVSGGAVGIDAAAHGAAVAAAGTTLVLLGCGHDVDYPRPHAIAGGLFDRVLEAGGALVSESLPSAQPRAHRVLARNRLVAALADAVVVVEGGARSGALNTASHAADQGVPVLAVPGDVRAPGSVAPNQLLAEGAAPCRDPDDILAAIGGNLELRAPPSAAPGSTAAPSVLPDDVAAVLAQSFPRPIQVDDLAATTGRDAGSLLAMVTQARIAGEVATDIEGVRLRRARP